jgi:hypothetical protein
MNEKTIVFYNYHTKKKQQVKINVYEIITKYKNEMLKIYLNEQNGNVIKKVFEVIVLEMQIIIM